MNPDDICWQAFGFPNPCLMPCRMPAEGLMKACEERRLPFMTAVDFRDWDIRWNNWVAERNFTHVMERLTHWRYTSVGQSFCVSFDHELKKIVPSYLNHLKAAQRHFSSISEIMWTWEELLLAAADNQEEDIADPGSGYNYGYGPPKGDLSVDWNLKWLLQRKKAVDLLRYAPVLYKYDNLSGYCTVDKDKAGMAEVIERAWAGRRSTSGGREYMGDLPATRVGLNEYKYSFSCRIGFAHKIYPEYLPAGADPHRRIYVMLDVTGIDGTDDSFAASYLTPGVNVLPGNNGVLEFDPDDMYESIPPMPSLNHSSAAGWKSTACKVFADFTDKFHFKAE